eukprot:CAMPEP_0202353196 /NCGR_PEP_ID=MMETSP1126-20121109/9063_1 /ASSEMBLY_ACC=CAM_ASM_000457 /TAXON_ID=3047 /ORGANISM="Dunaliella tertiolecta, Strain CCMP1320" /LENGTH=123 /DNA_ID=CAMNT_0048945515 /DNA_START=817 /DNA_END=1187 /DNA_ORIENTATION=-
MDALCEGGAADSGMCRGGGGAGAALLGGLADEEVALLGAGAVALFEPPTAGAAGEYKGAADAAGSDGGAAADGAPTLMVVALLQEVSQGAPAPPRDCPPALHVCGDCSLQGLVLAGAAAAAAA